MTTKRLWRTFAVLTCLALAAGACGDDKKADSGGGSSTTQGEGSGGPFIVPEQDCANAAGGYQPTAGVQGDTITVGTVRPASGNYAPYDTVTTGVEKYFAAVNAKGGVKAGDGKQYRLVLKKGNDEYNPGKTLDEVKKLVEKEGVFGIVGEIGTDTSLAARDYMNQNCVPSIALGTGSTLWGDAAAYPWYISGLPSYATEARAFMDYLNTEKPTASIALLYQDDDFGRGYRDAIKKFISDTGSKITLKAEEPVASNVPSTEAATVKLAGSQADVFVVGVGGTLCPTTLKNVPASWKPMTYVSIVCSGKTVLGIAGDKAEGIYSTQALYDPANPEDQSEPAVAQYITDAKAQGLDQGQIEGGILSAGWGFASIFVRALELSPAVTRADVMNTVFSFKDQTGIGLIRDEVPVNTDGATDPWLIEGLRVIHREQGNWVKVTEMKDYNGQSNSFCGGEECGEQ